MHFNFVTKKNTLYVTILGELDHHGAEEIRDKLDGKIITEGISRLVFDLSGLTLMDSSGIGVIMGRYKLIRSLGGEVQIISGKKSVDKLLQMSGIGDIIPITESLDEEENNI